MANDHLFDTNSPFPQDSYADEVDSHFDAKVVSESRKRMARMTEEKLAAIKHEGEEIIRALAALSHLGAESPEVQMLIRRHHMNLENFYHVTREIYQGLAEMYILDDRFTAYYNNFAKGLADFLSQAMNHYCNTEFKEIKSDRSAR